MHGQSLPRSLLAGGILCVLVLSGCAHSAGAVAKEAAEDGVPAGIEASLIAMNKPENQKRLANILNNPALREASQDIADNVERDLQARMSRVAAHTTDSAMAAMWTPRNRAQAERFVAAVTRAGVEAGMQGVAEGLATHIGPAVEQMLATHVARGVVELARHDLATPAGNVSHEVSRQFVLGAYEAVGELDRSGKLQQADLPILKRLNRALSQGQSIMTYVAIALALAVIALVLWLRKITVQTRAKAKQNAQREASAMLLADAIRSASGRPWSSELNAILKEKFRDREQADYIRELLEAEQAVEASASRPLRGQQWANQT